MICLNVFIFRTNINPIKGSILVEMAMRKGEAGMVILSSGTRIFAKREPSWLCHYSPINGTFNQTLNSILEIIIF